MVRCSLIIPFLHTTGGTASADAVARAALAAAGRRASGESPIAELILVGDPGSGPHAANGATNGPVNDTANDAANSAASSAANGIPIGAAIGAATTGAAVDPATGATSIRWTPAPPQSGFAAACNAGAALATQPFILFLAPDVQPSAGWLAPLLARAAERPRLAVAGSKLLSSPDIVHHAGIAVDGRHWPRRIYAGFPAAHPAVNTTRRMQMVSAGSLLVRHASFVDLDGFDVAFGAEDAALDLCLRLGGRGEEIWYCHDSVATCPPGGPLAGESPTDPARSRRLFRTRWIHELRADDVQFYQADRLIDIHYDGATSVLVSVQPPLMTALADPASLTAEQMLAARSQQVRTLLDERVRLHERIAVLQCDARRRPSSAEAADALRPAFAVSDNDSRIDSDGYGDADASSDEPVPSDDLALSVGGAFRETGEEFFSYFTELGGLRPDAHVLDVGCGVGRMALPLARYLSDEGTYEGFDVMANAITWCQQHITPRHPRFHFQHVALRNRAYNTSATATAAAFAFPYPDASFDFVFLTSVFTHLMPDEVQHYLREIARVLKPGGRCFCTYFLLNPESEGLLKAGLSPHFAFSHRLGDCRVLDINVPEAAVAFDESLVRRWHEAAGLTMAPSIHYGFWCGRLDGLSLQDIVLATRS